MHLKFAPEWGIFFAWKVWCNTGIFVIFAEEIATGGGEGNCHILLAFFQDIYKGLKHPPAHGLGSVRSAAAVGSIRQG
jgi:hypothetical protein